MKITHDLHQHSRLSACCTDERLIPEAMLRHGAENGYDTLCVTDHCWDCAVPGASGWYAPQNIPHVSQSKPLPTADGIRFLFGCETEYCGGDRVCLKPKHFALFDFVAIPVNHFHMKGYTCPPEITAPEALADLQLTRLEELSRLDLPWRKIGIAHFTSDTARVNESLTELYDAMPEDRLYRMFRAYAQLCAGIELNACGFPAREAATISSLYRPYQIALEAGCRFYFASDAHCVESLDIQAALDGVMTAMGLEKRHLFTL